MGRSRAAASATARTYSSNTRSSSIFSRSVGLGYYQRRKQAIRLRVRMCLATLFLLYVGTLNLGHVFAAPAALTVADPHLATSQSAGGAVGDVDAAPVAGQWRGRRLSPDDDSESADARGELPSDAFSDAQLKNGAIVLHVFGILYMFLALAIVCDEYFVPALEVIAEKLELSNDVAGATFMAAGGSAPELFTSFMGTFVAKSQIGFGTIVGSAVFNVLFVIGLCAVFSKGVLELTWWPLARDCSYYAWALAMLSVFFAGISPDEIEWWESLTLFLMYALYVVYMKYNLIFKDFVLWLTGRDHASSNAVAPLQVQPVASFGGGSGGGGDDVADDGGSGGDIRKSSGSDMKKAWTSAAVAADAMSTGSGASGRAANLGAQRVRSSILVHRSQSVMSLGGFDMEVHSLAPGSVSHVQEHMLFRAGIMKLLTSNKSMLQTAGVHVISHIEGDIHATFTEIDTSGDGTIDMGELRQLLERVGASPSDEDVASAFEALDKDQSGTISFEEFKEWYDISESRLVAEMRAIFDQADHDSSGFIDVEELKLMLNKIVVGDVSDEMVLAAMTELDVNGDGKLSYEEFQTWYSQSIFWKQRKEEFGDEVHDGKLPMEMPDGWSERFFFVLSFPIVLLLWLTLPDVRVPHKHRWCVVSFVGSILWIGVYSYFMVWWATVVGVIAGIPDRVMGVTFIAAGTSVPDLLTSVIVAKQGFGDMAVSSSIGSNIFDVLVGLPLPWLIWSLTEGRAFEVESDDVLISVLVLIAMLVCVVSVIALNKWVLSKPLAYAMFFLYAVFLAQDLGRADWD